MEEATCWNCIFWRTPLWVGRAECTCVGGPYYRQNTLMYSNCDCFAINPNHKEREDDKKEDRTA